MCRHCSPPTIQACSSRCSFSPSQPPFNQANTPTFTPRDLHHIPPALPLPHTFAQGEHSKEHVQTLLTTYESSMKLKTDKAIEELSQPGAPYMGNRNDANYL